MQEYKIAYNQKIPPRSREIWQNHYNFQEDLAKVLRGEAWNVVFITDGSGQAGDLRNALKTHIEYYGLPLDLVKRGRYVFAVYNEKKRQALTPPDA